MQAELSRLEEQLGRALEGEAWHGPSALKVLEGVSAEQAAAHPIVGVTQHDLYHAGQIALLKKALGG